MKRVAPRQRNKKRGGTNSHYRNGEISDHVIVNLGKYEL